MKFGIFYELQLPRPWQAGGELKLYQDALTQLELADPHGGLVARQVTVDHLDVAVVLQREDVIGVFVKQGSFRYLSNEEIVTLSKKLEAILSVEGSPT